MSHYMNFHLLYVYGQGQSTEHGNEWELPITYPIAQNPDRPPENWHPYWGNGWIHYWPASFPCTIVTEFIDPNGSSRGRHEYVEHNRDQIVSTYNVDFDVIGIWKLKGTMNGHSQEWDALNIVDVDNGNGNGNGEPPDPIHTVRLWNPHTNQFQTNPPTVYRGEEIGLRATLKNIESFARTYYPTIRIWRPYKANWDYHDVHIDPVYLLPGQEHTFDGKKPDGWYLDGLSVSDVIIRTQSHTGGIHWQLNDIPTAYIEEDTDPDPDPDPGLSELEITSYSRI